MEHHNFGDYTISSSKESGKYRYRVQHHGSTVKSFRTCIDAVKYINRKDGETE